MTAEDARGETVPLAFARALLHSAQSRGCDIETLLREAEFPCNPANPVARPGDVSVEQYSRLCFALFRALNDESGGIMREAPAAVGTTRLLLHAVIGCKTLDAVLKRAAEFNGCCRERSRDPSAWLDSDERTATLCYRLPQPGGSPASGEGALCGMAIWLRLCSWLIGRTIEPHRALCGGPRPVSTQALRHFFHCPLEYGAAYHGVTFSAQLLQAPVVRSREDLAAFLPLAPYHLVIAPVAVEPSFSDSIRRLIGEDFFDMPGFEALTSRLNMSARTLRRRLDREGTSFQRIKDNARRDAAISLLSGTRLPIAEVAHRVGFSDPSAFHRSFKKWTGLAPGEYR